jgi:pyrroloquinoline quinone biosynthesis protein D
MTQARPKLAPQAEVGIDPVTGNPILLYPEGILHLNASAHAILSRCDGFRSVENILEDLSLEFEAAAEELRADVLECLCEMEKRRLIFFLP